VNDEEVSPDGRTLVRWEVNTGRMSHEIWTPTIIDVETGTPILELPDAGFDGRPVWTENGFTLKLRHYWRPGILDIAVDHNRQTFSFGDAAAGAEPLAELSRRVEDWFREFERETARAEWAAKRVRLTRLVLISLLVGGVALAFLWLFAH
jgi:hypothetical protein